MNQSSAEERWRVDGNGAWRRPTDSGAPHGPAAKRVPVTIDQVPEVNLLEIRRRLGRDLWSPPEVVEDGAAWRRYERTRTVIVTVCDTWPDDPGVVWVQASISSHPPTAPVPSYEELKELHAAVWGAGWAFQVFAPPLDHINIRSNALHLWGRADGTRVHPNFGWRGTI